MPDKTAENELIKELRALLSDGEEEALQIFLRLVRPEDIAEWLDVLTVEDRQRIVGALDADAAGTVLTDTTVSIRADLVDEIEPERLARIAEAMPPDDAADLIGELEVGETEEVLYHISSPDEEVLRQLLTYPGDTAGGIMHPEAVALQPAETVDDAIQVLHAIDEDTPIAALYVVDEYRRLLGYVRLRNMVTARPASSLGDIMSTDVISVTVDTDQEEVADLVDKFDFVAIPVVDAGNRLVGVVTVDDVLDVIEKEATEDIYKMAGSSAEEEESESILHVARYRLPWLLVCLAGTQLSSFVLIVASREVGLYDQMSVFTAAIMAMAGNTSLQSSTTTVRRLALDTLPRSRFPRHILREIVVALLMGIVCGAVASLLAVLLHHNPLIGIALGPAMAIGMSAASLLGTAMPMLLDIVGVDPAVASGPLVSTINDSLALAVYFSVATAMLLFVS
ncbi:MAG: magnesium transporter [Acidobacteriota bacterium]|jgi:magnesium transporter|nr:magnesium transporter [Acidobacteriota bacterium]